MKINVKFKKKRKRTFSLLSYQNRPNKVPDLCIASSRLANLIIVPSEAGDIERSSQISFAYLR